MIFFTSLFYSYIPDYSEHIIMNDNRSCLEPKKNQMSRRSRKSFSKTFSRQASLLSVACVPRPIFVCFMEKRIDNYLQSAILKWSQALGKGMQSSVHVR